MTKFRYGLKSLIISELDADGSPINPIELTKYVYTKTYETTESEGSKTEHHAANQIYASIILRETVSEVTKFTLFNFPLSLKESLKGGTATELDGKTTYSNPVTNAVIERHVVMVTKDDVSKTYFRCFVDVVKDHKFNDTDVEMLKVTLIPMLPIDGSAAVLEKEL